MATETCSDALSPAPSSPADISAFTTDEPRPAETSLAWETFKYPKLHKYPLSIDDLTFEAYVGRGVDGVVFKAQGGGQTVAVKFFLDNKPPARDKHVVRYWPFKRECTNCMILDKIQTRLRQARATGKPVFVHPDPKTHRQALRNLRAFSDEGRVDVDDKDKGNNGNNGNNGGDGDDGGDDLVPLPLDLDITINPCLGWTTASGELVVGLSRRVRVWNRFEYGQTYYAIVYRFVEAAGDGSDFDPDKVLAHLRFFHQAGFFLQAFNETNWRGDAVLVDFSDLTSPLRKYEWLGHRYARQMANTEQELRFCMSKRRHVYSAALVKAQYSPLDAGGRKGH